MSNFKSTKPAPYVYMCTNRISGQFYIGYREANVKLNRTSDVDFPVYQSSSKSVKESFEEFDWVIMAEFKSGKDAFDFEHALIYEHWSDPLLLNQHCCHNGQQFRRTSPPWNKNTVGLYSRSDATKKKIKEKRAAQVMRPSSLKGKSLADIHSDRAEEIRKKISNAIKLAAAAPGEKERKRNKMLELWQDDTFKQRRSQAIKDGWDKGRAARAARHSGGPVYTFEHESGIVEKCTRAEIKQKHKIGDVSKLLSGKIKSSMGWTIRKDD